MNPSTAFGVTFADELVRCGLREVVLAPGSRSTPLAMAFGDLEQRGRLRLHVRVDERSASFTALGLAKASRRPVAVLCTSGTAAANFHPAVIEADESAVPLLVLTCDRPPEMRATGANQAIDQIKLYGAAARWCFEVGVPELRPGAVSYWRSLACQAWAQSDGTAASLPGPVHLNLAFREPLVPDTDGSDNPAAAVAGEPPRSSAALPSESVDTFAGDARPARGRAKRLPDDQDPALLAAEHESATDPLRSLDGRPDGALPGSLGGRPDGEPWTSFGERGSFAGLAGALELPWTERGVVVCGDGDYDATALIELAERAGWPLLAEPSSGARTGPNALSSYQYLLADPGFMARHRPDVIVSAGRPGLSRAQTAFLGGNPPSGGAPGGVGQAAGTAAAAGVVRRVVIAQGPGRWADSQRVATDVAAAIRLTGADAGTGAARRSGGDWLRAWTDADAAARRAVDAMLDAEDGVTEPRIARDLATALPEGALLWAGSSMPIRDLDSHMAPRDDIRVLASRGASGIDGTTSAAIGAALAHRGPSYAIIGDLAFLHDVSGLALGPREPRPDLCLVVVNNDGGGIFSTLEQAAFGGFERLFGTPHGAALHHLAAAFGVPYQLLEHPDDLAKAVQGSGLRIVETRTDRIAGADFRTRLRAAATQSIALDQHPRSRGEFPPRGEFSAR